MRILLGLVKPDGGTATILGRRYRDLADRSHVVGAALEASSCHPDQTARDNLRVRALAGRIGRARIEQALDLVELSGAAGRRISGFSLGMRTPRGCRLSSADGGQARLTAVTRWRLPRRLPDGSQNSPPGSPSRSSRALPSRPAWKTCSSG